MLKFRSLIFFLFALTVLFSAVLASNKVRETISIATTLDIENPDLEIKHFLLFFQLTEFHPGLVVGKKITQAEIDFINLVYNLTLLQLLESHRIALPPPQLT